MHDISQFAAVGLMLLGEGRITGNSEQHRHRRHKPPADLLNMHRHPRSLWHRQHTCPWIDTRLDLIDLDHRHPGGRATPLASAARPWEALLRAVSAGLQD